MNAGQPTAGDPETSWVEVYRSPTRKSALEHALMLQAVGIEQGILQQEGELCVLVHPDDAGRARGEIERYTRENVGWPPPEAAQGRLSEGAIGAAVFAFTLVLVDFLAGHSAFGNDWLASGRAQSGLIKAGELWRTVTALTLHADLAHLLSNLFFGGLFVFLSCEVLGAGFGGLAIGLAGALGNLLNALMRPSSHSSIGASTAVFGALGLLVAYQWMRRSQPGYNRVRRWGPVLGGSVLLATLGMGGGRIDVIAHTTGFASGCALGFLAGLRPVHIQLSSFVQSSLVVASPALLAVAWFLAFAFA